MIPTVLAATASLIVGFVVGLVVGVWAGEKWGGE